jgi:hypothetical protein
MAWSFKRAYRREVLLFNAIAREFEVDEDIFGISYRGGTMKGGHTRYLAERFRLTFKIYILNTK